MKVDLRLLYIVFLIVGCREKPVPWNGPELTTIRDQLTVEQLLGDTTFTLLDMSYFAKPDWAIKAAHKFSGVITFQDTDLQFPLARNPYPGERIFPRFSIEFISHDGVLIPKQKRLISTRLQSESLWDVIIGSGKVWQEKEDGEWSRASFPFSLTERYIGQVRNCVATFVYQPTKVSKVCVQCSQETADLNDRQLGNLHGFLKAQFLPMSFVDSTITINQHLRFESERLPVLPLEAIDLNRTLTRYFEKSYFTNASTSLGALLVEEKIYLHPPQTRHGAYPYPSEMRHGIYSVTKSLAGTVALLYLAQRYGDDIFDQQITDYVPALADHPGWEGVSFGHTLNMVTGTEGSERAEHLLNVIVLARSAEEAIQNIGQLGDYPEQPGQKFNYASTNLFVLSYAMQNYVQEKEGREVNYWDLVQEHVLEKIGADYFGLQLTEEEGEGVGIPLLAYGAYPTIDEVAKIALLLNNHGNFQGQQLLHKVKTEEALGRTEWLGYTTNNDDRGSNYHHAFWSKQVRTSQCKVKASYMLGYGGNYVVFLPSKLVVIRFMDEYDLKIAKLVRTVEQIRSSCQ